MTTSCGSVPFRCPVACRVAKNICAMMCGNPSQQLAQQGSAPATAGDQPAPEDVPAPQSAESIARQVRLPPFLAAMQRDDRIAA